MKLDTTYFFLILALFSVGLMAGGYLADEKQVRIEQMIDAKVEKKIEQKFSEKEANMKLYEAIYYDKELEQTMYFFFRSDDNPFWRANEIMEIEGKEFSNLRIRESKLLEEEK